MRDMDENLYQSPNETSELRRTEQRRATTLGRMVIAVVVAVVTAFALLAVWTWTARFPWSSGW